MKDKGGAGDVCGFVVLVGKRGRGEETGSGGMRFRGGGGGGWN